MDRPTIAVLGGGQLGRMLGLAAARLGVRCRFLDPKPDATAGEIGPLVVGELDDDRALAEVLEGASVATYEWEGVPADAARFAAQRVPVAPDPVALEVAQDRAGEKETFARLGIATAAFARIERRADLDAALSDIGFPAVLKTRRGGYDGKGQVVLSAPGDADAAWARLGEQPLLLEAWVDFERELSIIACRGTDGTTVHWPVTENTHERGILRLSRAPAPGLDAARRVDAETLVDRLLDDLGYVGTIAVELFDTGTELLANELAPRVHNSGHWTIDGAATSQFENHVRAVLGWPLGPAHATAHCAMVNCLGAMPDADAVLAIPGAHLHDYAKSPAPQRKVGHVTLVADDPAALSEPTAALLALTRDLAPAPS